MPEAILPNGRRPESSPADQVSLESLARRVRELEALCGEVYVAAVDIGLPQALLNRLWTVAAQGSTPHAYDVDLPPRLPAPGSGVATNARPELPPIPNIALTDRPGGPEFPQFKPPELQSLPQRRTVMIVDDDPMMLEVLERILRRENYALLTAMNGPEALSLSDAHPETVDLLVTDYVMPTMHGRQLAEKMRERYADLKVLYQTGFSDMLFESRVELEDGAAFLEKPFTSRGLREAARFALYGSINPQ